MRYIAIAAVFLIAGGLAFGQTTVPSSRGSGPVEMQRVGDEPGTGPTPPPVVPLGVDADTDGWVVSLDCNDDDPLVNPDAIELLNGIDDNCNGVVDEGYDTTFDFAAVKAAVPVYPDPHEWHLGDALSLSHPPRVAWIGDRFLAAWIDERRRLRLTTFGFDGKPEFTPITLAQPVNSMDFAWTGSHAGIVFEDGSGLGTQVLRLVVLDRDLQKLEDTMLAVAGTEPRIAWGQDRFGIVWNALSGQDTVRFQRFGVDGIALSKEEVLESSGGRPSVAFDGTIVVIDKEGTPQVHEGMFGVAYEAQYAFNVSGDVLLTVYPRAAESGDPVGPVRVNYHGDDWSEIGTMPTVSANQSGFLVAWHAYVKGKNLDMAQSRYFSHDTLAAVQEFIPDGDAARYGRLTWTGSEFVMANDNRTTSRSQPYDVHVRRFDPTGNTHVTSPSGAWSELNMRGYTEGTASVHPDLAIAGELLGVIWVQQEYSLPIGGRLWLSLISHR